LVLDGDVNPVKLLLSLMFNLPLRRSSARLRQGYC